jgi:hypothetical protein
VGGHPNNDFLTTTSCNLNAGHWLQTPHTSQLPSGSVLVRFCWSLPTIDLSASFLGLFVTRLSLVRDALELIHGRKFEAFVFDTAMDNPFLDLLSEARISSSNHHAVILAVAKRGTLCDTARRAGANFVLEPPLTSESINRTGKAAYG